MNHLLIRYKILTNRGGTPALNAGNYLNIYWDDVANAFVVNQFDDNNDTTPTVRTSGPDLGSERGRPTGDYEIVSGVVASVEDGVRTRQCEYTFCEGSTLHAFQPQTTFPYVKSVLKPNNFSCLALVCDLAIDPVYTVNDATDTTVPDGSISVTATSSNGPVKYGLTPDFNYTTGGQLTGAFNSLYAGSYTVYVKDALGCTASITLVVKIPNFYNPLYRLDFEDINHRKNRVDILQRGYTGDPIAVKGTKDPFVLKYRGEGELNKFKAVLPSDATISLISESNFYFRELFSQDDRKFKVNYYKDYGNVLPPLTNVSISPLSGWAQYPSDPFLGTAWTLGTNPSVTITSEGGSSKYLYTLFGLEAGRTYKFNYSFNVSLSIKTATIKIDVTNSAGTNLGTVQSIPVGASGIVSGTYIVTAPAGADRVRISVTTSIVWGGYATCTLTQFDNVTEETETQPAGLELKWTGFVISQNYSEAYIAPPYPIAITATDGLADLKNQDFKDFFGNKFSDDIITLNAIVEILRKTDLNLNIQSGINKYEQDMLTGVDNDPLNQCKFNPETFYNGTTITNCYDVLTKILEPFGARLVQRKGKWIMYCVEEAVHEFAIREFDYLGLYLGNTTVDDLVSIRKPVLTNRAAFRDQDQVLEIIPTYGVFFFIHKLLQNPSLVKSYSFEQSDLTTHDGLPAFKNWNVQILNAPGATYGIKQTKAFEGEYAFYYRDNMYSKDGSTIALPDPDVNLGTVLLKSLDGLIEYDANDAFEFKFNYAVLLKTPPQRGRAGRDPAWIRLKWLFQVGSYYYNENKGWTTDANFKYNSIYVSTFNEVQEFRILGNLREVAALTLESFHVEFVFSADLTVDITDSSSLTNLKAIPTVDLPEGERIKDLVTYLLPAPYPFKECFQLINSTEAESIPSLVRPDDWDADDNPKMWQLTAPIPFALGTPLNERGVEYNYLDNVVLNHLPKGNKPPDNITIEKTNNLNIKSDFEHEYVLNDIDIDNINNSERIYKNYFKKLDGTPTQVWTRTYRPGSDKLLALLSSDFVSQYKRQSNKLTGSLLADVEMTMCSIMNEVFDGGRKYMFMGFELHAKENTVVFDMAEVKDVVTDSGSDDIDAGFTKGFSLGFRS